MFHKAIILAVVLVMVGCAHSSDDASSSTIFIKFGQICETDLGRCSTTSLLLVGTQCYCHRNHKYSYGVVVE